VPLAGGVDRGEKGGNKWENPGQSKKHRGSLVEKPILVAIA